MKRTLHFWTTLLSVCQSKVPLHNLPLLPESHLEALIPRRCVSCLISSAAAAPRLSNPNAKTTALAPRNIDSPRRRVCTPAVLCVSVLTFIHTAASHYGQAAAYVISCLSLLTERLADSGAARCYTATHLAAFHRRGRSVNKSSTPLSSFQRFSVIRHWQFTSPSCSLFLIS